MGLDQPGRVRLRRGGGRKLCPDRGSLRLLDPEEMARRIDAVGEADIATEGAALLASQRSVGSVLGPKAALTAPRIFAETLFA